MKKLALSLLLLALGSASSYADALLFAVKTTPYDKQMARIRPVLTTPAHEGNDVSLLVVNQWMTQLRSIPYGFTAEWKTPEEAQSGAPADCKAKAVALYDKMISHGAKNVRLVIGKRSWTSRKTHAWLAWETSTGSYLLDPTFFYNARLTKKTVRGGDYAALFAYEGSRKFRAGSNLIASN